MTDRVTSVAGLPSGVFSVTVTVLPAGNGLTGNPVTLSVSAGDVPVKSTSPLGPVTVTVIESTLVVPLGTEISVTMGVTPSAKGNLIESLGSPKVIPGPPGARSDGDVELGAPVKVGSLMS
jgi:hypothetical protein